MKYADGPTTEVETYVDASPDTVWRFASDPTTPAQFSEELQEVRWVDDEHFVGRNRHPIVGEWETTCTIVANDPPTEFAWVVGEPDHPMAQWRFILEPRDEGTVLRQRVRLGPAPSGLTPAIEARPDKEERIIERRLEEHRTNMQATIEGIGRLAEQAAGAR